MGRREARRGRHRVADHRGRARARVDDRPDRRAPTRSRPPLLIHGHLDVVPADPAEWSVDPFAGEVQDGYVWGRGAIDMKDMDAMTLALVREWARTGRQPAARHRARLRLRRGGRRPCRARTTSSTTTRTCSPTAPRRSARSADSAISLDDERPPLPDPDRGEGHRLAAAQGDRPRPDTARWCIRQRRHPAGRGREPDRRARVADHRHRHGARHDRRARRGDRARHRRRRRRRVVAACSAARRG